MGNINKFIKDFDIKNPYYLQNIVNLRKLLPSDFALAISKVVERSGLTQEEIAECTKVSIDTLKRWKSESDFKVPKIDKLVAFCIGLNLPLEISEELIKNSGTGFQNTVSDMALRVKLRA
ncbi:helix-turn-helix domain-containing protein [Lactococcus lactis]|nr:helix-turn-helix transcriptional regulator [Lactococcus lactis]